MPVVSGGNENAQCHVQFRMVKQEMWDECLFDLYVALGITFSLAFLCCHIEEIHHPVGGWRGWHCLCWPTGLCSSLVSQASEKIPVGKIIFHKGKASLSAAHFSSLVFCKVHSWIGLCQWRGQGWELCRADVQQVPGPCGRMAVHGQH